MSTIDYYNENANYYFDLSSNSNKDIDKVRNLFLKYMKNGGKILDFGCGSGRDSKFFKELGYEVSASDGSLEMCRLAKKFTGLDVICMDFNDLNEKDYYDGIWACSSLLHVQSKELEDVLIKIKNAIKSDGCIYISLKNGKGDEIKDGRYFNYVTKEYFESLCNKVGLIVIDYCTTKIINAKSNKDYWHNFILKK